MSKMASRVLSSLFLVAIILMPMVVAAQEPESLAVKPLPDVATILREFECEVQDPDGDCHGRMWIAWIRHHQHKVQPETMNLLLDGLERLALTTDIQVVRQAAMSQLATFGSELSFVPDPMSGILPRLLRIYRQTDDLLTRSSILGHLAASADRAEAVDFLALVAQQDSANEEFDGSAERAVRSLGQAGPVGAAALRDLDMRELVKDEDARALLHAYAKSGYQSRDD